MALRKKVLIDSHIPDEGVKAELMTRKPHAHRKAGVTLRFETSGGSGLSDSCTSSPPETQNFIELNDAPQSGGDYNDKNGDGGKQTPKGVFGF